MKDFETYKIKFTEKALEQGYSDVYISKCLEYSKTLLTNNLPIIYSIEHLSKLVGYNEKYIVRACISTTFFYRSFKVKKHNGSFREISEPLPSLKEIQNFILTEILYTQKVSKYCKSYIPKKKYIEFLKYHTKEQTILSLDIKDFFPSINFRRVEEKFVSMGYNKKLSEILSLLCTYPKLNNSISKKLGSDLPKDFRVLPQGASTSPYLSNLILNDFDKKIGDYCSVNNLKYTRYADDLAFSGNLMTIKDDLIKLVNKELNRLGLKLNSQKTKLMHNYQRQIISGVTLNQKMQVSKDYRHKIRQEVYYIKKFGIENHIVKIQEERSNYLEHLIGKIQYVLSVNKKDEEFIGYIQFLKNLIK